jgi:gamma-glutamyl-gamma-aminobutyrate hydrolase PuuD
MPATLPPVSIGIYGSEVIQTDESRGCALWAAGTPAAVKAADGTPVTIELPRSGKTWDDLLEELDGIVILGTERPTPRQAAEEERLCQWCYDRHLPTLAINRGMQVLNTAFGGTTFLDLPKEQPQALQHRHPPEPGLRHAIAVVPGTRLANLYGEGEIVVNSEHRTAVNKVARGFIVSAQALDGIVECIESEDEGWFALGVQWNPASASASGLDIQLFRGLTDNCRERLAVVSVGHRVAA